MIGAVALAAVAAPAHAATDWATGITFYGEDDFGFEEPSGYPAGVDWFFGDVNGTDGTWSFTPSGLALSAPAAGMQVQILDQDVSISSTSGGSADLRSAVMNSTVVSDTDEWTFQLPLFYNGESGFTTLRPSVTGVILAPTFNWISSQAIPAAGAEPAIPANTPIPLDDILANLDAQTDWELLAYGLIVDGGETTVQQIAFDGEYSFFSPLPTATATPASLTAAEASDEGIALSASGLTPGYEVDFYILPPGVTDISDSSAVAVPGDGVVGDANGEVAAVYQPASELAPGVYTVIVAGAGWLGGFYGSGAPLATSFEITAPELAATGADVLPLGAAALGVLLLGLAVLAIVRIRRAATED